MLLAQRKKITVIRKTRIADIKTVIKSFIMIAIGTVISIGTAWIPGSGYFMYRSCVKKGIEKYKKSLSK